MSAPDDGTTPRHGVDCAKAPHGAGGFLHLPEDDGPYDVDGVIYCGRCHAWIDSPVTSRADDGAGPRKARCGVIGEPEAGRKVCELAKGHDGYHQQGSVRWLGYFPKDDGAGPAVPRETPQAKCEKCGQVVLTMTCLKYHQTEGAWCPGSGVQLRVDHARMQGAADGFQQGWHAALTRVSAGDDLDGLCELVPRNDSAAGLTVPVEGAPGHSFVECIRHVADAAHEYLEYLHGDKSLGSDEFKLLRGRIVTTACQLRAKVAADAGLLREDPKLKIALGESAAPASSPPLERWHAWELTPPKDKTDVPWHGKLRMDCDVYLADEVDVALRRAREER